MTLKQENSNPENLLPPPVVYHAGADGLRSIVTTELVEEGLDYYDYLDRKEKEHKKREQEKRRRNKGRKSRPKRSTITNFNGISGLGRQQQQYLYTPTVQQYSQPNAYAGII